MEAIKLRKSYNPEDFEERIYHMWKNAGYFSPRAGDGNFVIVIPPPNVTGDLHMGHGLNCALQDILIRYWRMQGRETLWVPGTDHAGIATHNVVERRLKERGVERVDLDREEFIKETWKVKDEHHRIIKKQLESIGVSCDWERERFTMDEGYSRAVREAFVNLWERDLLYRGEYLVNWCTSCGTALSDDEVEHEEEEGRLWEIFYAFSDGESLIEQDGIEIRGISVQTTRPETMFGDVAVAVNPNDRRYGGLIGRKVQIPIIGRQIPIIADSYVDVEFGSGALKITPAHDMNDFEIGKRHDLERIRVIDELGNMNEAAPEFVQGHPVAEARRLTTRRLEKEGALVDSKEYRHQVGHCYRCYTVVEPFLSNQWFVKMAPLAKKALESWKRGEMVFFPRKWENTYRHWLENIRDWCISRQIWWGHRIPAWLCKKCGELLVLRTDPSSCPKCGCMDLERDEDVLDTWFSSWLWPFSVFDWPLESDDLQHFFPTTSLVTAYDIIFFWVARMIMASLEFTGKVPFREIYITGLFRDKQGRKMSKSLGNGIDPLEVVAVYGADAMKFTLAYISAQGEDILMDMDTNRIGSRFANKIWNAARFVLMNLEGRSFVNLEKVEMNTVDRWIVHRFNNAVGLVEEAMVTYRFDDMAHAVYEYFWNDYCDWYVECAKLGLYKGSREEKNRTVTLLVYMLEESLKLLHPFLPFITEEIWGKLPDRKEALIVTEYPKTNTTREDEDAEKAFNILKDIVSSIRTLRSEFSISSSTIAKVRIDASREVLGAMEEFRDVAAMLSCSDDLAVSQNGESLDGSVAVVGSGFTAHVFICDLIDVNAAISRFRVSLDKTKKLIVMKKNKLLDKNFVSKAPADVVDKERLKLVWMQDTERRSVEYLEALEGKKRVR
ncbi:valyl-tRNA synthetase [Alkalispirochaeta odontotermitis]|nr:valyl-tRNA synthetase [Alkalispirochaeta odontotermitis]